MDIKQALKYVIKTHRDMPLGPRGLRVDVLARDCLTTIERLRQWSTDRPPTAGVDMPFLALLDGDSMRIILDYVKAINMYIYEDPNVEPDGPFGRMRYCHPEDITEWYPIPKVECADRGLW